MAMPTFPVDRPGHRVLKSERRPRAASEPMEDRRPAPDDVDDGKGDAVGTYEAPAVGRLPAPRRVEQGPVEHDRSGR